MTPSKQAAVIAAHLTAQQLSGPPARSAEAVVEALTHDAADVLRFLGRADDSKGAGSKGAVKIDATTRP